MSGKGLPFFIAALAAVLIAAAACPANASADPPDCPSSTIAVGDLRSDQVESSLTCLINETRMTAGRRPVRSVKTLTTAAAYYSTWMVLGEYFGHIGTGGSTVTTRLQYFGYLRPGVRFIVGENLSWETGPEATPEAIVDGWMESPEHRGNLLRPGFRDLGVGVTHGTPIDADDWDGVTVTTDYGARRR
jgi:uncharacterized protein YkwD